MTTQVKTDRYGHRVEVTRETKNADGTWTRLSSTILEPGDPELVSHVWGEDRLIVQEIPE